MNKDKGFFTIWAIIILIMAVIISAISVFYWQKSETAEKLQECREANACKMDEPDEPEEPELGAEQDEIRGEARPSCYYSEYRKNKDYFVDLNKCIGFRLDNRWKATGVDYDDEGFSSTYNFVYAPIQNAGLFVNVNPAGIGYEMYDELIEERQLELNSGVKVNFFSAKESEGDGFMSSAIFNKNNDYYFLGLRGDYSDYQELKVDFENLINSFVFLEDDL
ncbi:hypothetical protein KJ969_02960 [Patescibacteria group bacterium]|nr:hypothetical protein [Patescibacteria group bacterium]MBU1921953.1 hypothetical protein [Patescibacteria group bacterium]